MITVQRTLHQGKTAELTISGHSGSEEAGRDLICAAVSAIGFGLCNALDQMHAEADIQILDNLIQIRIIKSTAQTETILNTGVIQLQTVEERYPEFILVKSEEKVI